MENPIHLSQVQITVEGDQRISCVPIPSLQPTRPTSPTDSHHDTNIAPGFTEETHTFPESLARTVFLMQGTNGDADHKEYLTSLISNSDAELTRGEDSTHSMLV